METPVRTTAAYDPVCLVIPPSGFLLDERVFPSLGVLKVASALEAAGVEVHVLDLSGAKDFEGVVGAHLQRCPARHVGITATTPQMPQAMRIAALVRTQRVGVRLILGGPHVTLTATSAKSERKRGKSGRACRMMEQLSAAFDVLPYPTSAAAIDFEHSMGCR